MVYARSLRFVIKSSATRNINAERSLKEVFLHCLYAFSARDKQLLIASSVINSYSAFTSCVYGYIDLKKAIMNYRFTILHSLLTTYDLRLPTYHLRLPTYHLLIPIKDLFTNCINKLLVFHCIHFPSAFCAFDDAKIFIIQCNIQFIA